MNLKFIELFGFKTFPDKIRIPFNSGINIIIGPNGCGKTNIVDAIRFILGERNLKDLRLKNMNDIVFHGSNIRNQSSVALCRGVFDNSSRANFRYKDFSEIMVERRHFKNKDTEYRINGISVPYQEYVDFFNESGLSKHYSIMDSSKINTILNYKPSDLRLFFEEVSGITKYKVQKRTALKKLSASRLNLLRVGDLLGEVGSRLVLLEEASEKMEEYKRIEIEKKRYAFALYDRTKRKINIEIDKYTKELDIYSLKSAAASAKSSSVLNGLTDSKASFDIMEVEYKHRMNEKNKTLIDLTKLNSAVEYGNLTVKNLESEILEKTRDITAQNKLKDEGILKLESFQNRLISEEFDIKKLQERLNILKKLTEEKKLFVVKIKDEAEIISNEIFKILEGSQNSNNKLIFNGKNIKNIETRIDDTKKFIIKISVEVNDAENALSEKMKAVRNIAAVIEGLSKEHHDCSQNLSQLSDELSGCRIRKDGVEKELMKIDIDISKLTDFIDNHEGFSEGAKRFLNAARDYEIHPLSDLIEVESGFENAVWEGASGILESFFVNNITDAEKALRYIGDSGIGEIKIFIPDKRRSKPSNGKNEVGRIDEKLDVVPLADKISFSSRKIDLEDIGMDFYYSKDIETVLKYIREKDFFPEVNIITDNGTIFFSNGLIISGRDKNIESQNLLLNKKKLSEYKKLMALKQEEFNMEDLLFNKKQSAISKLNLEMVRIDKDIKAKEREELTIKNDIRYLKDQIIKSKDRLNVLKKELNNLETEKVTAYGEEERLNEEIAILEDKLKSKSDEKVIIEKNLRNFETEFEGAREDEVKLRIEINSAEQSINFLKKQINDLDSGMLNYDKRIKSLIAQKEGLKKELERMTRSLSVKQDDILILDKSIKAIDGNIHEMEINLENLKNNINDMENDMENTNRQKLNIERKRDAVSMRIKVNGEKLSELDSDRNLSGLSIDFSVEDENFIPVAEEISDEDIKLNIEGLNKKIIDLGDINMNATKEYNGALERLDFLHKQKKDLESSIEILQGIIKKLDAASKEKFNSALARIRQKFNELFVFLFGGGHADILNVEGKVEAADEEDGQGENNLPGMEINVQIPGKKFSGINILSQGERVLVAVGLLFAVFFVKKTPFCVIDEVDAPLDYANNARYNRLIMEVSNYSQVVLITHNKKTMEIGKNIFGVTLKHPDISGIVSVSMN